MIYNVDINLWAVLAAAAFHMMLGSFWYGPLFGKIWMKSMGWNPDKTINDAMKKEARNGLLLMIPTSLCSAFILAHFVDYTASTTLLEGAQTGFWVWLGFQATLILQYVAFEGKSKMSALLNAGYQLVGLLFMGALLSVWA